MKCKNKKCGKRARKVFVTLPKSKVIYGCYCRDCGRIYFDKPVLIICHQGYISEDKKDRKEYCISYY